MNVFTSGIVTLAWFQQLLRKEIECQEKRRRGRQGTRFPNIVRHARELGVNRNHLYLVLRGDRTSHTLLSRYNALLKEESAA